MSDEERIRILTSALTRVHAYLDSLITNNVDVRLARPTHSIWNADAAGIISTFNVVDFALDVTDMKPTLYVPDPNGKSTNP